MANQASQFQTKTFMNRLKKIIQQDDDVGKINAGSSYLVACALESFLDKLLTGALEIANSRNARTLTSAHLKASVLDNPMLDFCKEIVASAPDLPPPGTEDPATTTKRPRSANREGGAATKRGRGRGRGVGRGGRGGASAADPAATAPAGDSITVDQPAAVAASAPQQAEVPKEEETAATDAVDNDAMPVIDVSFLNAAPGKEAEEEDYDA